MISFASVDIGFEVINVEEVNKMFSVSALFYGCINWRKTGHLLAVLVTVLTDFLNPTHLGSQILFCIQAIINEFT